MFRWLRCFITGHEWDGYQFQPLQVLTCKRCGYTP